MKCPRYPVLISVLAVSIISAPLTSEAQAGREGVSSWSYIHYLFCLDDNGPGSYPSTCQIFRARGCAKQGMSKATRRKRNGGRHAFGHGL